LFVFDAIKLFDMPCEMVSVIFKSLAFNLDRFQYSPRFIAKCSSSANIWMIVQDYNQPAATNIKTSATRHPVLGSEQTTTNGI